MRPERGVTPTPLLDGEGVGRHPGGRLDAAAAGCSRRPQHGFWLAGLELRYGVFGARPTQGGAHCQLLVIYHAAPSSDAERSLTLVAQPNGIVGSCRSPSAVLANQATIHRWQTPQAPPGPSGRPPAAPLDRCHHDASDLSLPFEPIRRRSMKAYWRDQADEATRRKAGRSPRRNWWWAP